MSEKHTHLNCTDSPQPCAECGAEIPPNSDHECGASHDPNALTRADVRALRDLLAKTLMDNDKLRDEAVAARAELYRLKDGCARCGSPGPKAEGTIWCADCLEWYREEWGQHSPCAQEALLEAALRTIHGIATRALAEPGTGDTGPLVDICSAVEAALPVANDTGGKR